MAEYVRTPDTQYDAIQIAPLDLYVNWITTPRRPLPLNIDKEITETALLITLYKYITEYLFQHAPSMEALSMPIIATCTYLKIHILNGLQQAKNATSKALDGQVLRVQ